MSGNDFVYIIYEGRLFISSKIRWNAKNGYTPDDANRGI